MDMNFLLIFWIVKMFKDNNCLSKNFKEFLIKNIYFTLILNEKNLKLCCKNVDIFYEKFMLDSSK